MKCAASPTISSAECPADVRVRSVANETTDAVEAVLFREVLAPVARAMGFFGETVVDAAVRTSLRARSERTP